MVFRLGVFFTVSLFAGFHAGPAADAFADIQKGGQLGGLIGLGLPGKAGGYQGTGSQSAFKKRSSTESF
jgi:hypothetical protein